jgi:hypothetical protein
MSISVAGKEMMKINYFILITHSLILPGNYYLNL